MEGSWPETDSARKMLSVKKNPGSGLSFKFFCRSKSIRLGSIPDVDNPLRFRLCSCFPGYRDHSGTESQKDSTIRLDFRPHVQSPLLYGWTVMELCIPPLEEKTERPSKGPDQPKTKEETVDRRKGQKSTIAYAEQGALGETSGTKEAPEEENDARVPEHLLFLVEGTRELCLTPAHTKEAGDEPKGSGLLCHQGRLLGHKAVKDYERTREGDLGNDDACERSQIQAVGPVDPEQIGVDLVAFAVDSNPDVDPTQLTGDSRSTRRNTSRGRSEQAGTGGRNGIRSGPGAMDPLDGESPMLHSLGSDWCIAFHTNLEAVWGRSKLIRHCRSINCTRKRHDSEDQSISIYKKHCLGHATQKIERPLARKKTLLEPDQAPSIRQQSRLWNSLLVGFLVLETFWPAFSTGSHQRRNGHRLVSISQGKPPLGFDTQATALLNIEAKGRRTGLPTIGNGTTRRGVGDKVSAVAQRICFGYRGDEGCYPATQPSRSGTGRP
ncbi:hypothetical protein Acr_00g0004000 [Actinidia rufa]|uniref:Uncharacterized protein n=1 Tax=Actinidia rufa TaxID=165716 RepID=A0A7J0D7A3_9ERIC|nr:hypothetical protein Acr_00g0004000 [Actinidia rufa]